MTTSEVMDKVRKVTSLNRKRLRLRSEDAEVVFPTNYLQNTSALHDIHEGE